LEVKDVAKKYNLVVVGAGPGGLMAAKTAAQEGMKVLLVEKKTKITKVTRTCAAGLITEPDCLGETVSVKGRRIIFNTNDFSVPYEGGWVDVWRNIRLSSDGYKLMVTRKETPVTKIFNKEILLEGLLAEVKKEGVTVENETMGIKAKNVKGGAVVSLVKKGRVRDVSADFVVAADGVNSRIVDSLGLNRKRQFYGDVSLSSFIVRDVECPYFPASVFLVGGGHIPGETRGCFLIPRAPRRKGGAASHELSFLRPLDRSPEEELKLIFRKSSVSSWFRKAKVSQRESAVMRFRSPLLDVVVGRVLLVGDAAAFIETYVQGAILYGFKAAKAAAKELSGERALKEYNHFWQTSYEYNRPEILEDAVRVLALNQLDVKELNTLFSFLDKETILGYYNEFTTPKLIRTAIWRVLPAIRGKHRGLARKLKALLGDVDVESAIGLKRRGRG
jgi:flavin-dependent dehydrogenase